MKKYIPVGLHNKMKGLFLSSVLVLFSTLILSGSASAQYVSVEISPPSVGVFSLLGYQQFTAYGVTAAGQKVDITDKVDWYLTEYPFAQQTMKPYEIALIDENGLLTLNEDVTWGRVSVKACYPKGCGVGLTLYGGLVSDIASPISILLVPKFVVSTSVLTDGALASSGGSIDPSAEQTVKKGQKALFTVSVNRGYKPSITGCSGSLLGSEYTTGAITSDCTVVADFITAWTLTVAKDGTGTGTVTTTPAGIDCGSTCNADFFNNDVVTLIATPDDSSTFNSWSGDADCSDGQVTMSAAVNCTATFDLKPTLELSVIIDPSGTGTGSVTAPVGTPTGVGNDGIDCSGADNCSDFYFENDVVTLTAAPTADSTFVAWDAASDCSACTTSTTCDVTMDTAKTCMAKFDIKPTKELSVVIDPSGTGTGSVTAPVGTPTGVGNDGIDCSGADNCSDFYFENDVVTLTAAPTAGSTFVAWDAASDCSACTTSTTCDVTMDTAKTCMAKFDIAPAQYLLTVTPISNGGTGIVGSEPIGIGCNTQGSVDLCSVLFDSNSTVTLTAFADAGTFAGWSADCQSCGLSTTCDVTMDSPKDCTATFGP